MSQAFIKEGDAGEDLPERPIPPGPNYVTPRGLELLKEAGERLVEQRKKAEASGEELAPLDRDLRYLEARIVSAIVVPRGKGAEARFGARVTLEDETGKRETYRIVGDDEARTESGLLAWSSPLAQAIFGGKAGDTVKGPKGPYKILLVDYP